MAAGERTAGERTHAERATAHSAVIAWFAAHARDLPWRRPDCTAWGVLVSEVMLQQTPVVRVVPAWHDWLQRWPTPGACAAAADRDLIVAWGRLGYPRRALRLGAAARRIEEDFAGRVPASVDELASLPGVGSYTSAAVRCFAFGVRDVVLDTNIRRVLARLDHGWPLPPPALTAAERAAAAAWLPAADKRACSWNAGLMELGALVCTAAKPACGECPVRAMCRFVRLDSPSDPFAGRRRKPAWQGTDRQVRGVILATLRERESAGVAEFDAKRAEPGQLERCLASLLADGLIEAAGTTYRLPSGRPNAAPPGHAPIGPRGAPTRPVSSLP